jgi:hypothetical protein
MCEAIYQDCPTLKRHHRAAIVKLSRLNEKGRIDAAFSFPVLSSGAAKQSLRHSVVGDRGSFFDASLTVRALTIVAVVNPRERHF